MIPSGSPRILVIRKDNIGDLVCTLPLVRMLRERYPDAWLGALVTAYNAEVLHGNPDLDAVFQYRKAKHLGPGESAFAAMLERLRQLWALRRLGIDTVLLPASGTQASARRMARLIGARRVLAFDDLEGRPEQGHEVERAAAMLLALEGAPPFPPPPAIVIPRPELVERMRAIAGPGDKLLGLHISARKPSQRWPAEHFATLIRAQHERDPSTRFALFWAPGDASNPTHPGDDDKARAVLDACAGIPVVPLPTLSLSELIAGLSLIQRFVCADGGHMHLAAALGKPIVCLFGKSDSVRWHPWAVPYVLLAADSQDVRDISVEQVILALDSLSAQTGR